MISIVKNFKDDISVNGISKESVRLLEESLGDKIITSIYPIGGLTTESSSMGVDEILPILEDYIETNREKPKRNLNELLLLHSDILSHSKHLLYLVNKLIKAYSVTKKETILEKKEFYKFLDGEEVAYNIIYSDNPIDCLFDSYDLNNIVSDAEENLKHMIRYNLEIIQLSKKNNFNVLALFIWKENSFLEFMCKKNILFNPEPTLKQLFNSLDGMHMIKEDLERVVDELETKWRYISKGYSIDLFSKNYDIWEDMLKNSKVSYAAIEILAGIFESIK